MSMSGFWRCVAVFGVLSCAVADLSCSHAPSTAQMRSAGLSADPPPLPNPPFWYSHNGVLTATVTAAPGTVKLNGLTYAAQLYNGRYIPPVWRVNPGDRIDLTLVNRMQSSEEHNKGRGSFVTRRNARTGAQPAPPSTMAGMQSYTNIHYHGYNVPPKAPGDDVFIQVFPPNSGRVPTRYNYQVQLPKNHPEGLFWFHPHPHGISEAQVLGGMSGASIVEGLIKNYYPEYINAKERVMLLKDFETSSNPYQPLLKTINGLTNSLITIAPGEVQVWRFANVAADAFFDMQVQDRYGNPVPMWLIAQDGNPTRGPVEMTHLPLGAGARSEVLVVGPPSGEYRLKSLRTDTGPQGDPNPEVTLSTVRSTGTTTGPTSSPEALSSLHAAKEDPRIAPVREKREAIASTQRSIIFSESANGDTFYINGLEYDPNRIDTTVNYPSYETWTVYNTSGELHVFHIHQLDFAVLEVNGVPQPVNGLQDTVTVPYQKNSVPGQVKLVMSFSEPYLLGEFVYHCHILGHEDNGMMANILVQDPNMPATRAVRPPMPMTDHAGHHK